MYRSANRYKRGALDGSTDDRVFAIPNRADSHPVGPVKDQLRSDAVASQRPLMHRLGRGQEADVEAEYFGQQADD